LHAVKLGVVLVNPGRVPVSYSRKALYLDCANTVAPKPAFYSTRGTVLPGLEAQYWSHLVTFAPALTTFPVTGSMTFEFSYGTKRVKRERQKHVLKETLTFVLLLTPSNTIEFRWFHVDE
jgi:hypothetical protein